MQEFAARGPEINESEGQIARDLNRKIQRFLDRGAGACHLRRLDVARLTANTLRHFYEARYSLREWVVMPNHVHAIVWPMPNFTLSDILKSWKQFISNRAKEIVETGNEPFWQTESYDHWIRNDAEMARSASYIRRNPVIAKLCARPDEWEWSSAGRGSV